MESPPTTWMLAGTPSQCLIRRRRSAIQIELAAIRKIRLFVASPGDVHFERDQLKWVVDEINATVP